MKTIRYAFWAIVALCLILIGLANRGLVTVRAMPEAFSDLLGIAPDMELPLFIVIFVWDSSWLADWFLMGMGSRIPATRRRPPQSPRSRCLTP